MVYGDLTSWEFQILSFLAMPYSIHLRGAPSPLHVKAAGPSKLLLSTNTERQEAPVLKCLTVPAVETASSRP